MNDIEIREDGMKAPQKQKKTTIVEVFKSYKENAMVLLPITIIILVTMCIFLYKDSLKVGANALVDKYNAEYVLEKDTSYDKVYSNFFQMAEERYHVKNSVSIEISNLKEEQKLEVLKVSDVEYIIEDSNSNGENIESWLEVPGEATFVVDLKSAEFIIDTERAHITIKAPYPELTNVKIDYGNVRILKFENDIFDESITVGEDLARRQLGEAELLIKKEFMSNQNYYLNAQKAAVTTIENLVKQLNPNVPDLQVEVEFY